MGVKVNYTFDTKEDLMAHLRSVAQNSRSRADRLPSRGSERPAELARANAYDEVAELLGNSFVTESLAPPAGL